MILIPVICLLTSGCGSAPAWVPLATAGLGFGAKAMQLDEELMMDDGSRKTDDEKKGMNAMPIRPSSDLRHPEPAP